jgi:hypothetical protein
MRGEDMSSRRSAKRWKVVGSVLALLIVLSWAASLWCMFDAGWKIYLALQDGQIGLWDAYIPKGQKSTFFVHVEIYDPSVGSWDFWDDPRSYGFTRPKGYFDLGIGDKRIVRIPLWMPLIVTLIPTAFLFWRDRRIPPGQCLKCRYDLTGNTSGVCPECGNPLADKQQP